MKTIWVLLFWLIVVFCWSIFPATYYCDASVSSGTHTGVPPNYFQTLAQVQAKSYSSGDIVSFKCGDTYSGTTLSGKSNITFNSYGTGAKPILDGQRARQVLNFGSCTNVSFTGLQILNGLAVNGGNDCNYIHNSTYFTFESCNINNGYCSSYSGSSKSQLLVELCDHITVRNSTINNGTNVHGIYPNGSTNVLLEYDTISYNGSNGINGGYDSGSPYLGSITVRYCVIRLNDQVGQGNMCIYDDGFQNSSFYYNVLESGTSSYTGIFHIVNQAYSPKNNSYYNNTMILHGSGSIGIEVGASGYTTLSGMTNMNFRNNIMYLD